MAGTLTFIVDDTLKAIVKHAQDDPKHRVPYTKDETSDEPSLFFVKDQGVYLMPASDVPLYNPAFEEGKGRETKLLVAYAKGLDPRKDDFDNWYEEARRICGGDDFGETLPVASFAEAIKLGVKQVKLKVSAKSIGIRF